MLTPGRYVGTEEADVDPEPLDEKVGRLSRELLAELDRAQQLDAQIRELLGGA